MAIVRLYFHLEDHNRALHPPRNGRQHCHVRLATDFLPNSGFFVKRNGRGGLQVRFEANNQNVNRLLYPIRRLPLRKIKDVIQCSLNNKLPVLFKWFAFQSDSTFVINYIFPAAIIFS